MGFKVFYCPLVGEGVFYEIIECREYHLLGHAIKVQLPNIGPAHYRLERVSDNELKYLERVKP
jgi:hypothetical protein